MPNPPLHNITILLADDEEDLLQSLSVSLQMEGATVRTFHDGRSVLDELHNHPPTPPFILIADIIMPGISGLTVLAEFKKRFPDQPAIAITGFGDKPMLLDILRTGCEDFLDKPFDFPELLTAIQRAFAACAERAEALCHRLAGDPTATPPPSAAEVKVQDILAKSSPEADEVPQVRLRALDALKREIERILRARPELLDTTPEEVKELLNLSAITPGSAPPPPPPPELLPAARLTPLPEDQPAPADLPLPESPFPTEWRGNFLVILLQSDCTGPRSQALRALSEALLTQGRKHIAIDLKSVDDLDSLALGVLCSLSAELRHTGGQLIILNPTNPIRLLLEHIGIEDFARDPAPPSTLNPAL